MPNETLASIGKTIENAARALAPTESGPPPPPPPPESAVVIEAVGEAPAPKRSRLESLVEATKEQLEAVAEKFKEATSETARRIVGDPEKTPLPRDARVLEVALELLGADEETASAPKFLRPLAERLAAVAQESGITSEAAREARRYLAHMVEVAPTLEDVALQAFPEIQGGIGESSAAERVYQGADD